MHIPNKEDGCVLFVDKFDVKVFVIIPNCFKNKLNRDTIKPSPIRVIHVLNHARNVLSFAKNCCEWSSSSSSSSSEEEWSLKSCYL